MNNSVQLMLPIQTYIEKNRDKIDESLVSLRFMKEVDMFLDANNISNKLLANDLGYSESFISQLMSGIKKVNTSFINKFEKKYNAQIVFSIIKDDTKENVISTSSILSKSYVILNFNVSSRNTKTLSQLHTLNFKEFGEYIDFEELNNIVLNNI